MLSSSRITKLWWSFRQFITTSTCFPTKLKFSSLPASKVLNPLDGDCSDFLPWLEKKAGAEISSKLYIGKSCYGRSLFASKHIQHGDCILRVPYNVQIASDNLLPKLEMLLDDEVSHVTKVAIIVLVEQRIGKESEWATYISCLPRLEEMHNTIFWSKTELDMIRQSSVYQETIKLKAQLEKHFLTIKPALEHFPEILGRITFNDFMHAYALVKSRAWGSTKGVSLIPFADFLNHDGPSKAVVINDDDEQVSEVIADRNYAPHEEVLIRYGRFSNATLLLDYGFALPYNIHDQVQVQINIPNHDILREMKLEILRGHLIPTIEDDNGFSTSEDSFLIKEVRSDKGKGKGLPQSLRAFARVLCCTSPQDLNDLAMEAAQNDGRLARRPLRNSSREFQAHEFLFSRITQLADEYNASIESLGPVNSPPSCKRFALRRQLALNLLSGELHVLESASAWLKSYFAMLLQHNANNDTTSDYGSSL